MNVHICPCAAGELANVEPMYQYSLAWFVALFKDSLIRAEKSRELAKHIEALQSRFTYSLYCKVCRCAGPTGRLGHGAVPPLPGPTATAASSTTPAGPRTRMDTVLQTPCF
jgi:hypothetical protein